MKKFFYRVTAKDSLFGICSKFNLSAGTLIKDNNLKKDVCAGDVLIIKKPERELYTVKPHESAKDVAEKFNTQAEKILSENGVEYLFCGLNITV